MNLLNDNKIKEKKFANTNLFIFDNYPCLETERKDRGGKG